MKNNVCTTEQDVSAVQLPDIYVCLKDHHLFKTKESQKEGYANLRTYLVGSHRAANRVTWEGKSNTPYANMTTKLFSHLNIEDITFLGHPNQAWTIGVFNEHLSEYFAILNGFCVRMEMKPANIEESEMYSLTISAPTAEQDLQVLINEPGSSPHYQISSDHLLGDIIETCNLTERYYDITFEKEIMLEEGGECSNYGEGRKFASYADCVANQAEEYLKPKLGCLIPWMGPPNHPNLCTGKVRIDLKEITIKLILTTNKIM